MRNFLEYIDVNAYETWLNDEINGLRALMENFKSQNNSIEKLKDLEPMRERAKKALYYIDALIIVNKRK